MLLEFHQGHIPITLLFVHGRMWSCLLIMGWYGVSEIEFAQMGETSGNLITHCLFNFQLDEIFILSLQQYNNHTVNIGTNSSVNIKILENDKPYGVLQFNATSVLIAVGR